MRDDGRNRALILVLLLVLSGLGVRVWYAAEALRVDRFVDEKYSLLNIRAIVTEGTLEPASSYYPYPLFNVPPAVLVTGSDALHRWTGNPIFEAVKEEGFGAATFLVTRLVQTLYGALALLLTYLIGREIFSREVGLIGASALVFMPWHIHASRYFKPDAQLVAMVLLAFYCSLKAVEAPSVKTPAQLLTNVILQAEICQRLLETDPQRARAELDNLKAEVNKTFQRTRMLIATLRPMMLDDLGLLPTLRRYVRMWSEEHEVEAEFTSASREHRLPPYAEVTVFRVVQEVLENVGRHANATHVRVTLHLDGDTARTIIEDDGIGFDVEDALAKADERRTLGLALVRDRAHMLGGTLDINSVPGRGTRVVLDIPETEPPA